ncbi:MAG: DNA polymerase III subunit delta' [Alphaproteobacteria bacterium]
MNGETAPDSAPRAPEPRANPHFEGHSEAEAELARAAASGRLHHAWLISGPRGVGKATLAFRFARFLLAGGTAESGPDLLGPESMPAAGLAVDPASPVFQRVASGGHADLFTLERGFMAEARRRGDDPRNRRRSRDIVIEDTRNAGAFFARTALEGGWRIAIVDGAEDMNRNSANALLKTLEEPPPQGLLLLVSHAPGRLLPTIRSRCRRLTLGRLDDATVENLMRRYRPDIGEAEVRPLALIGEGSIGRALQLADAGGLALYEEMVRQLSGLPRPEVARLHGALDAIARTRSPAGEFEAYDVFAELLTTWLARQVTARARGLEPAEIMPGEGEVAARLAGRASLDQWVEVWEKITLLFGRAARLNLDRKQVLLDAFFALGRTAA